jgi:hypothetical protein
MEFTGDELILIKRGLCCLKSQSDSSRECSMIFDLLDRLIDISHILPEKI